MRMFLMILVVAVASCFAGCSGVILSAKYSTLLDETAAISKTTADRAEAGALDANTMKVGLRYNASAWTKFQDGRDGRESGGAK